MDLFLVNYRHSGSEPLKSITQLPRDDAFRVAEKLYGQSQCYAHRRFGPDFTSYYEYRLKVEQWLYDSFLQLGGKPQTRHPFYFVLQYCDAFCRNFGESVEVRLPLQDIDPSDISFTFGDSMAQMETSAMEPLFLRDTLYESIRSCDNDVDRFLASIRDPYVCIEAQLWTDRYFTHPGTNPAIPFTP